MSKTDTSNSLTAPGAASPHVLPPLPYAENALEPIITAKTIGFHYGKHHKGYVDNLNKFIVGTEYVDLSLEKIIATAAGRPEGAAIFNNAAQIWNHTFYWKSMSPKGEANRLPHSSRKSWHPSAASMPARRSLPVRPFRSSEAVGVGLSSMAVSSRW